MSPDNPTLFDVGCAPVFDPFHAADATRVLANTCWEDCGHCGMTVYTQMHKKPTRQKFKLCHFGKGEPTRVFADTTVCPDFLDRLRYTKRSQSAMPTGPGWEDY